MQCAKKFEVRLTYMKNAAVINMHKKRIAKQGIKLGLVYIGLFIIALWAVFPLLWMVQISLKEPVLAYNPSVWIFKPVIDNYTNVFADKNFDKFFVNSVVVTIFNTILALVLGTTAAYGFSRFKFKYADACLFFLLVIRMVPSVAIVIPVFLIGSFMHLIDTRILLIVTYLIFNVPFVAWMMKGFFDEIPKELDEAAMVDGCTTMQSLYKVILPMVLPGIVATSIFCVISSWNEFVYALFLTSIHSVTTPTIVQSFLSIVGVVWGEMSAVGTMAVFPVLIFAMIVQKHMIRGLTFGAVKG